tara:strand:+ start:190 stop:432 length:243 start_codon:yes stop_codon:yes gene_type:complete
MGIQELRDQKKALEEQHRDLDAQIWKQVPKFNYDKLKSMKLEKLAIRRQIEKLDLQIRNSITDLENTIKSLTKEPINVNV